MFVYLSFIIMHSPQPPAITGQALSASQRGAKMLLTLFFALVEKGEGGMSTWNL